MSPQVLRVKAVRLRAVELLSVRQNSKAASPRYFTATR